VREDHGPLVPISTYGASKLAGEALISSYAYMFGFRGVAFRFGNVVGPRQTHGVAYDFIHRLKKDASVLSILGDGKQSKPYVHIEDIMNAVLLAARTCRETFTVFNVATPDTLTVTQIASIVCANMKLDPRLEYSGGDRGWKGDVPVVRLNTERIRRLGWTPRRNSEEAMRAAVAAMLA
jgi:UDP-glucose 4-epimerase